jgi:hypothetical protein
MPATYGIVTGIREPWVHDEFSYLLGADTFARGRLTNPTPPLPEFFESPHIIVVPSYNSKYPPGQALVLAAGQVLTGRPVAGVWLGCGLFAACLCWMLHAWTSRQWALSITILMAMTLGTSSYWAQSYWGGMLSGAGGALLFGGMRRVLRAPQIWPSVLMTLGVLILANTRPYEGLLASMVAILALGTWCVRNTQSNLSDKLKLCVVPACIVLASGGIFMALYNRAVTGNAGTPPYALHQKQYFPRGPLLFSSPQNPERHPVTRLVEFYQTATISEPGTRLTSQIAENTANRFLGTLRTPFGIAIGRPRLQYSGLFIALTLLTAVWCFRSQLGILLGVFAAILVELLLAWYAAAYFGVVALLVLTAWVVTICMVSRRHQWTWFAIGGSFVVVFGGSVVMWWWPHYSAPVTPLLLAAVAITCQRVARRSGVAASGRVGLVVAALFAVHLLRIAVAYGLPEPVTPTNRSAPVKRRSDIVRRLHRQGGQHLVFVRYDEGVGQDDEWVYNAGDLKSAPVIFAHDLGDGRNPELTAAFPERSSWLLSISPQRVHIEPYSSGSQVTRVVR